jgi:hypothetical protein
VNDFIPFLALAHATAAIVCICAAKSRPSDWFIATALLVAVDLPA